MTNATIEARPRRLVDQGYQRLLSFECRNPKKAFQREGYEWFGGTTPPHEPLTAYGLMLFRDLTRVYSQVDPAMLERTRQFLLSRKDGTGGFQRRKDGFHGFGNAPDHIVNAYIVWALTESSATDDVARELTVLLDQAKTSTDPYFLALVANSVLNRDKDHDATDVLKKLAALQTKDGYLAGAERSITYSSGRDLQIEATSLAVLAWLKSKPTTPYRDNLQAAVKWLSQQRGSFGAFGSTQATVLTLKALTAVARNAKAAQNGLVTLYVNDRPAVQKKVPAGTEEVLVLALTDADRHLQAGKNQLRLEITGENEFPYTLSWSYHTLKPPSADRCPVRLTTQLDRAQVKEGETVRLKTVLENQSAEGEGMTLAIVGLPAGLTLPEDFQQLKDYARPRQDGNMEGTISHWELRGRELILYWRGLAPHQKIELNLDLIARVPGTYRGPASRAYLYYNADHKHWVEPLQIAIQTQ